MCALTLFHCSILLYYGVIIVNANSKCMRSYRRGIAMAVPWRREVCDNNTGAMKEGEVKPTIWFGHV
jgi:hypothetical protein